MAVKKPSVVYGGPYSQESDAITLESAQEKPDYDNLISGWKTISQGAVDYIASLKKPAKEKDGPFINNVVIDYDKVDNTLPEVKDFDRDREKVSDDDLIEDTDKENTNGAGTQTEVDLDDL